MEKIRIYHGDCIEVLIGFDNNSIDSIVTDPPYGISFMGKHWDYDVPGVDVWKECLRVLKPGGHLLSFGGSRTYHRMAVNIEDAGFEIRDQIMWVYGCLSDDTEILTKKGWEQYRIFTKNSIFAEEEILVYDTEADVYKWEKPQRWNEYTVNEDTAYRIQSDNTDQIVSRGHRCVVEREGKLLFISADELNGVEYMPTLPNDFSFIPEGHEQVLQSPMQRTLSRSRLEEVGEDCFGEIEFESKIKREQGGKKSCVEGRIDLFQAEGEICEPINQICEMSGGVYSNVEERRVCNGTPIDCCVADWAGTNEGGVCSSSESQRRGQPIGEFNAFQFQCGTQALGTRTTYKTSLATVTPISYSGIIFCPTVSTGAFVARRNGKVFITGNSGFPKSLNVGKAVDKLMGNERKVVGERHRNVKHYDDLNGWNDNNTTGDFEYTKGNSEFEGWGTALKPAHEPIVLARKPISEKSIAENCLKWGTGGLNIDGCRVAVNPEVDDMLRNVTRKQRETETWEKGSGFKNENNSLTGVPENGRFPANFIHDGSEEVVGLFPETKSVGHFNSKVKMKGHSLYEGGFNDFEQEDRTLNDSGSAARFFYCAKASKRERDAGLDGFDEKLKLTQMRSANGTGDKNFDGGFNDQIMKNNHPTVKPIALMRYLCRLITPKGGTVLDPFTGSGSTGCGAVQEGFNFIGIEREQEYVEIAKARIEYCENQSIEEVFTKFPEQMKLF